MFIPIPAINASGATLEKVASSSLRLNTRHRHVEEALVGVVDLATSLLEECENRSADCQGLPHPSIFVLVANYSTVRKSQARWLCDAFSSHSTYPVCTTLY